MDRHTVPQECTLNISRTQAGRVVIHGNLVEGRRNMDALNPVVTVHTRDGVCIGISELSDEIVLQLYLGHSKSV